MTVPLAILLGLLAWCFFAVLAVCLCAMASRGDAAEAASATEPALQAPPERLAA